MDEDIKVEIIWPQEYVDKNLSTMGKFTSAVLLLCRAAVVLGQEEYAFVLEDISVVQIYALTETVKKYGIELEHIIYREDGMTCADFYANVRGFRKYLEESDV